MYRKVESSRPVYYSILELFSQRSQYISIKFPLHKPSENLKMCCYRDRLLLATLRYMISMTKVNSLTQFWVVGHGVLLNTRVITQDKFEGADFQNGRYSIVEGNDVLYGKGCEKSR